LADGRLHASFSVEPDAASSYGKPMGHAYSTDEGQTWRVGPPQVGHESEDGVLLPNGDRLQPVQRPARRTEEFDLPQSVCDYACSFQFPQSLYRAKDLPAELNEWRFRRLPAGGGAWIEEVATMRIPDQLASVIDESACGATPGVGGSVICLMRTSDGNGHGPLYLTRSVDGARTWSRPVPFVLTFNGGKMPQLLTLEGGVTLASYGQSGGPGHIAVRATTDPAGLDWQAPVPASFSPPAPSGWNFCGHTEMVALDDRTALLVYSDFNYPDANGVPRKSILVRRVQIAADAARP
jgi:hypothetical protein